MDARPVGYMSSNMQQNQRFQSPQPHMNRYSPNTYATGPQRQNFMPNQMPGGQIGGGQMQSSQMSGGHMGSHMSGGPMQGGPMSGSQMPGSQMGGHGPPQMGPRMGMSPSMGHQPSMHHQHGMSPHPGYPSSGMHRTTGVSPALHAAMEQRNKRPPPPDNRAQGFKGKKRRKMADKILPQRVRDLVPESQAYMDLLAFERKLDSTIMRKRLGIQEALKRPMKVKKKLRIFISNTFYPPKMDDNEGPEEQSASWELRVEGRLIDENSKLPPDPNRPKRKFSSFFKSLVIELDKELYGPDNHLVEWHRTTSTQETDGFQVKRPGDQNVKCTVLLMLDYQPMQFKLDSRLARLLGIHTQTRPVIINALWQYIKTHKLQDSSEREYINTDKYLEQIFECPRMKFTEIPQRLHPLLMPPDPIVINHLITVEGPDAKKTACYDIDVEVDDQLKQQMSNFLLSTQSQNEISNLDNKIHETVDTIQQLKISRDFMLSFAKNPQEFINSWLASQSRDLKTMTDVVGNPEEERSADFFHEAWSMEAVNRYFYGKVNQKRAELEQALGLRTA